MPTEGTITLLARVLIALVVLIAGTLVIPWSRRRVLGWFRSKLNADFTDGLEHRILVLKDEEGGGIIPGEKWRNAVQTAFVIGITEVILLIASMLVLPAWWKLVGLAIFGTLIIVSIGLWMYCFTVIREREVGLLFRKGHLYGYLRPGWYLVARPFGFERLEWTVDRNRREARDLEVQKVLTADDLQAGFDLMVTMEVMDLHTLAPHDIRHPDPSTHPADDPGAPVNSGKLLAEKGKTLPWNLQSPYLRIFRYQLAGEGSATDELSEEIEKAANTISFLYCISSSWEQLKGMFAKPSQTVPREDSVSEITTAIAAATTDDQKNERRHASLQQLIRNYLEPPLYSAGLRIVDVRIKNIVPPQALLDTKTAELEGEAELRKIKKITEALKELGDLAGSDAARFFLTEKSIEAFKTAGSSAGSVIMTTPEDTLRRLEVNIGKGAS